MLSVVLAACVILSLTKLAEPIDRLFYDRFARGIATALPDDIVVVAIDDVSLQTLGQWPWPRGTHAQLIDILSQSALKAIVFDVLFTEPAPDEADDLRLAQALRTNARVLLPVSISELRQQGQIIELMPIPPLAEAAAALGHIHYEIDSDGISRSVFLKEGIGDAYWPHIAVALSDFINAAPNPLPGATGFIQETTVDTMLIRRSFLNLIPHFGPGGLLRTVSYIDILQGNIPLAEFDGKILFIGATAQGLGDTVTTPVSGSDQALTGVELNATIFEALRTNSFIQPLSRPTQLAANLLCASIAVLLGIAVSPRVLLRALVLLSLCAIIASFGLLLYARLWFAPTTIILCLFLAYPLWSLQRLEQAIEFLRNELARNRGVRPFFDRDMDLAHILCGLRAVQSLLPIAAWDLRDEQSAVVTHWDKSDAEKQSINKQITQDSWPIVLAPTKLLQLSIRWEDSASATYKDSDVIKSLIASASVDEQVRRSYATEIITASIERLQRANHELLQMYEFSQKSLAQMQDGVLIFQLCGRLLYHNELAFSLLSQPQAPAPQNQEIFGLMAGLTGNWHLEIRELLLAKKAFSFNTTNSARLDILCQGKVIDIGMERDVALVLVTDVSEIKALEASRAEALNFLSHDLRSPLVSILALVEKSRSAGKEEYADIFKGIEDYAKHNLAFAESYLSIAKVEHAQAIELHPTDMYAVVDNAIAQVYLLAENKSIHINSIMTEQDCWVSGNGQLLERALINLLVNAIKYSEPQTRIDVQLVADEQFVRCIIADQGMGIAEHELSSLFAGFRRSSRAEKSRQRGVGLGLRFVDVACQRLGASVDVTSQINQGSTFTISLKRLSAPLDLSNI